MVEKIVYDGQIWDLHVHTPYKYNKSANSYNNDTNQKFVDEIVNIIRNSPNKLKMISFTDHNYFNEEVYKLFEKSIDSLKIQVIPGIEIDLKMSSSDKKVKHILFYFPENVKYEVISKLLNDYISSKKSDILFDEFVTFLFENEIRFAISPHAFKQGSRGIESDWNDDNDRKNHQRIKMYSTDFFVFWEADKSSLPKAKDFIKKYYSDGREAITNFSDSHDYEIFKRYLDNPTQYFYSLNNFNGILMASSEVSRITSVIKNKSIDQKIKEIVINNQPILLSDKLNVIIGGRGKGKSILLDKIGFYFDCNKEIEKSISGNRKKFLDKFSIKLLNFNGNEINKDFKVKYLHQAYIDTLFSDESSKKIESYFEDEFEIVQIENVEIIFNDIKKELLHIEKKKRPNINVVGINEKLINNVKKGIESVDLEQKYELIKPIINVEQKNMKYNDYILSIIPKEIINDEINYSVSHLTTLILKSIIDYNFSNLKKYNLQNISYHALKESNEKHNFAVKEKNKIIDTLKEKLTNEYEQRLYIMRIVNKLYEFSEELTKLNIKYTKYPGENKNEFYFVKYNNVEHPIEFARRILLDALNGKIVHNKEDLSNKNLFLYLLKDENVFNSSYNLNSIINSLITLDGIKHETKNRIIHYVDEESEFQDLSISSPGVQTNSIMEYILNQESNIPLLIDQPEDNVDNESRYSMLTKWIKRIKNNRQIILVSHDANIVINGDAENIIIADCVKSNFSYSYGALEYNDNIEIAAKILDGGKNAIRRRIQKYGE